MAVGTTASSISINARQASRSPPRAGQRASTSPWAATTATSSATGRGSRPLRRAPASAVPQTMSSTSRGSGRARGRVAAWVAGPVAVTSAGLAGVHAQVGELGGEPLGDVVLLDHPGRGLAAGPAQVAAHGEGLVQGVGLLLDVEGV